MSETQRSDRSGSVGTAISKRLTVDNGEITPKGYAGL